MGQPLLHTMLNGAVADGDSKVIDTMGHHLLSHQIITTGTTSGTVKLYGSNDGETWEEITTDAISTATTTWQHNMNSTGQVKVYKYIKANLSSRTNGTFTSHLWLTGHGGPAY